MEDITSSDAFDQESIARARELLGDEAVSLSPCPKSADRFRTDPGFCARPSGLNLLMDRGFDAVSHHAAAIR
jgi:hypothetical protein